MIAYQLLPDCFLRRSEQITFSISLTINHLSATALAGWGSPFTSPPLLPTPSRQSRRCGPPSGASSTRIAHSVHEMSQVNRRNGEGPPSYWGRSVFSEGTFPTEMAPECPERQNRWGRPRPQKRPLKNPSDYLVRHIKRIANSQHIFGFLLSFL